MGVSPFRDYLELVRVFLTPTAVGDSFAGFTLARLLRADVTTEPNLLALACGCSVLAYWLGMASNDLFDLERDRVRSPAKPLASSRISPRAAVTLCCVLGLGAITCGFAVGVTPVVIALIVVILAYNGGVKRVPLLGNLFMGGARSLNLLLGGAAAVGVESALETPELRWAAVLLGLYIAGVTTVSVLEDRPFARGRFLCSSAPLLALPVVFICLAPSSMLAWTNSLVLGILLAEAVRSSSRASVGGIHPAALFVRKALGGIFFVDAGCLVALAPDGDSPVTEVAGLYLLFVVTRIWTRRWIRRGAMGS